MADKVICIFDGQLVKFHPNGKPTYKAERSYRTDDENIYRRPNGDMQPSSNKLTFNTVVERADKIYFVPEGEKINSIGQSRQSETNPYSGYYSIKNDSGRLINTAGRTPYGWTRYSGTSGYENNLKEVEAQYKKYLARVQKIRKEIEKDKKKAADEGREYDPTKYPDSYNYDSLKNAMEYVNDYKDKLRRRTTYQSYVNSELDLKSLTNQYRELKRKANNLKYDFEKQEDVVNSVKNSDPVFDELKRKYDRIFDELNEYKANYEKRVREYEEKLDSLGLDMELSNDSYDSRIAEAKDLLDKITNEYNECQSELDRLLKRNTNESIDESMELDEGVRQDFEAHVGKELFDKFMGVRQRLQPPQNDMSYWIKQPVEELETFMSALESGEIKSKSQQKRDQRVEGADLIFNQNGWKVYHITTYEAAKQLGSGTTWCITGRYHGAESQGKHYFNQYIRDYKLNGYYFIFDTLSRDEKTGDYLKYCAGIEKSGGRLAFLYNGMQDTEISRNGGIPITDPERVCDLIPDYPNIKIPFDIAISVENGVLINFKSHNNSDGEKKLLAEVREIPNNAFSSESFYQTDRRWPDRIIDLSILPNLQVIGVKAFANSICYDGSLQGSSTNTRPNEVIISDSVTKLSSGSFFGLKYVTKLTIGEGCKNIPALCFGYLGSSTVEGAVVKLPKSLESYSDGVKQDKTGNERPTFSFRGARIQYFEIDSDTAPEAAVNLANKMGVDLYSTLNGKVLNA